MTIAQKREILAEHYSRDWANSKTDYQILAIYTKFLERINKLQGIEQRKLGKLMLGATCPICNNVYLMDYLEGHIEDFNEESKEEPRVVFHCEDCDRDVRAFKWKVVKCGNEWLSEQGYL